MQMRLIMILFFICASLGPAFYVCGQGLPSEIGGEYAAGKNITGDDCKLRRTKPGVWGGKAEKYALYCEGWSQPSGQLIVLRQGKRPIAWWLEESEWAQDIRAAGTCEAPQAETPIDGVEAMARRCQHRLGWRRLMLAAKSGQDLFVADFLPNNAPLIERALLVAMGKTGPAVADVQGKRMVTLRAMEEMIGKETDLPSIKEIGELSELGKLAYHQHEARLYRPSELTWRRVLAAQERFFGLNNPALALTLLNMSHPVRNQRRFDDALALVKRAEPLVLESRNPSLIAKRYTNLAYDAHFRNNNKAAAAFADEAIIALPSVWPGSSGMRAEAYYALAIAKYGLKDYANAERAARQAVELAIKALGSDYTWTNRDRMLLARVLTAQKKFSEAKSHLSEALHSAELMFGQTIWWANAKVLEAGLAQAMGNPAQALEANRAFASVASKEQFSCYFGPCFSPYLDLLATRGGADSEEAQAALREAFSVAQLVESPVVSAAINQLAARVGAGDEEISGYTRMQQDLGEQQIRLRAQLMQEFRKPEKKRSKEKEETIERQIRQLQAQIDEGELKMQDRFPKYARLVARRPVDAERISELLQADEALLYFSHVGDKGYTFLMHQGRLQLHAVGLSHEELRQKIMALRVGLTLEDDKLRSFDTDSAHALYRDLVGPLLDLPGRIRRLVIVPTGPLLSLPPDLLVSATPGKKGKTEWLARRFAISVLPDVRALMNLRGIDKSATTASGFLGIGNPKFAVHATDKATDKASGPGAKKRGLHIVASPQNFASDACAENWDVRAQVAQLAPLPESADEVRIMSAALGARKGSLLLAEKATKSGLRKAGLETKEIIAFATHGLLPEDLYCESEPSLALAPGSPGDPLDDGLLRASEIAVMRLQANLVILSACNTAGANGKLGGESLSGLVRAFFYAGARNVLATHWPIASQPTVDLTTGMVSKRAMGLTWSDALRESKVQMMDNPATSHPFFWGAFSLVGGG
jgi:CHAT domain-containing protein